MIGVHMGLDYPFDAQSMRTHMVYHAVGMFECDAAGSIVDVHDRIDDGARARFRVCHDIGDRMRLWVEKAGNIRPATQFIHGTPLDPIPCSLEFRE